jgi:hypothetical protein
VKDIIEKYTNQHKRCLEDVTSLINLVLDNYTKDSKFKQILINLEKYKNNLESQTKIFNMVLIKEVIEQSDIDKLECIISENEKYIKNLYDAIKET